MESSSTQPKGTNPDFTATADRYLSKAVYDVPTELWHEVFSYLDYPTLKTLPLVSRLFNCLLERPAGESRTQIDRILFRDTAMEMVSAYRLQKGKKDETVYTPHPCFRGSFHVDLGNSIGATLSDNAYGNGGGGYEGDLSMFLRNHGEKRTIWTENAVSPATQIISLRQEQPPPPPSGDGLTASQDWQANLSLMSELTFCILNQKDNAVTVFDVLVARVFAAYRLATASNEAWKKSLWEDDDARITLENYREQFDQTEELQNAIAWVVSNVKGSILAGRGGEDPEEEEVKRFDGQVERLRERIGAYKFFRSRMGYTLKLDA